MQVNAAEWAGRWIPLDSGRFFPAAYLRATANTYNMSHYLHYHRAHPRSHPHHHHHHHHHHHYYHDHHHHMIIIIVIMMMMIIIIIIAAIIVIMVVGLRKNDGLVRGFNERQRPAPGRDLG